MDPVTALVGVMASLPQCIQAARQLYDMRNRFKGASMLITAIYSESMVIAASLSQVQNLLQYQTLQSKPQLLETFDRALTGCRVVYECLQEEVQDLVTKVENEQLMFKDRAKFLWKGDDFKELLQQIRGQQMTLSLLIQGLQMESLVDIKNLVQENCVVLDQVMTRSKTLKQTHPRVHVPESIFNQETRVSDATEADIILKSTEFAFDDQVINSKAYRKAMAHYTAKNEDKLLEVPEDDLEDDDVTVVDSTEQAIDNVENADPKSKVSLAKGETSKSIDEESDIKQEKKLAQFDDAQKEEGTFDSIHQDLFDSLEHDILAFMPSNASTALYTTNSSASISEKSMPPMDDILTPKPLRESEDGQSSIKKEQVEDEKPPPLPPRRPSERPSISESSKKLSISSDNSTHVSDVLSKVSTASSYTTLNSSQSTTTISRKAVPSSAPELVASFSTSEKFPLTPSDGDIPATASQLRSVELHNIWSSLVDAERVFYDHMTKLRTMFYDKVITTWPLLEKHLGAVLVGEQLANLNKEVLLQTMEQQLQGSNDSVCNPVLFEVWASRAQKLYREYCKAMPHATSSLRTTQNRDPTFAPFVNTLDLSSDYFSRPMEEHFRLPVIQLQLYLDKLHNLIIFTQSIPVPAAREEMTSLQLAVEAVTRLKTLAYDLLGDSQNRENVQSVEKRIHTLNADYLTHLRLFEPSRRVRHQGGMAIKLKSHGAWNSVHVILLDNYLFWGKVKSSKKGKGDKILVLDAPIAVDDLETVLMTDANQFQKTTMFDKVPQGLVLYLISIKDKNSKDKPHLLGAYGYKERNGWWNQLSAATDTQDPTPVGTPGVA